MYRSVNFSGYSYTRRIGYRNVTAHSYSLSFHPNMIEFLSCAFGQGGENRTRFLSVQDTRITGFPHPVVRIALHDVFQSMLSLSEVDDSYVDS